MAGLEKAEEVLQRQVVNVSQLIGTTVSKHGYLEAEAAQLASDVVPNPAPFALQPTPCTLDPQR